MSYENPEVPHEVNVARENALVEFARLVIAVGLVVASIAAALYFAGGWLARLVPFATERSWTGDRVLGLEIETGDSDEHAAVERYLQRLSDELAAALGLPEGMAVRVHYTQASVPNAFATLGGHVVVTSELYRLMPSENALAMVLAHEIAHVEARDPIALLGGGASLALVLALASGEADGLVPQLTTLVALGYSRSAETRADERAVSALVTRYGHAGGAASVFEVLGQRATGAGERLPSFLSTHPADANRIAALEQAASSWDEARMPLQPMAVRTPHE